MDNVYNEEDVKRKIAEIDKRFHLVMILEQFEVRLWINMNKLVYITSDLQESLILIASRRREAPMRANCSNSPCTHVPSTSAVTARSLTLAEW